MFWQTASDVIIQAPVFPLCQTGENYDVTLTLVTESGEALSNAYLFLTDASLFGYIQAKLSTGSEYRYIGIAFDAFCYLGPISASAETDIDFRISIPGTASDGRLIIPVAVGHDDAARLPNPFFTRSLRSCWQYDWPTALWQYDWPGF